jgi:hypothetical protein
MLQLAKTFILSICLRIHSEAAFGVVKCWFVLIPFSKEVV